MEKQHDTQWGIRLLMDRDTRINFSYIYFVKNFKPIINVGLCWVWNRLKMIQS